MQIKSAWLIGAGLVGVALFGLSGLIQPAQSANNSPAVQNHKPLKINRLYTGSDGQTHVEEIEAKFAAEASGNDI
jgi:hypothetical protein